MTPEEQSILKTMRIVYGGALLNGPFSVLVGHSGGMIGLNDRTKLRPMTVARKADMLYISSEEAALRVVCDSPEKVWHAEGGDVLTRIDEKARIYKRIVLKDSCVVGALLIGDIDRAGIYTGLIRERVDVTSARELLLSDEFGLLSLPVDYRKHVVKGEGIEV